MNQRHQTTTKLAQTAIFAALCYVAFAFLQIKIPVPGGDATSIHAGNAFCALAAPGTGIFICKNANAT